MLYISTINVRFYQAKMLMFYNVHVQDDPKLPGDSGEVPIFVHSGWLFDFCFEIFSLLDPKKKKERKD